MVTLGNGATQAVSDQISSLGSNILTIRPGQGWGRGGGGPRPPEFEEADIEAIRAQIVGVSAVAPRAQTSVTAVRNASNWSTTVNGTTGDYLIAQQWQLDSGRTFTPAEEQSGRAVCIIGATVRDNLFGRDEPLGERFRLGDVACEVIGTLTRRGQSGFGDQDDTVLMPIKAVQRRFTGNREIENIMVAVDPAYETAAVQRSIESLLRERREVGPGEEDNFRITDTQQIADTLSGTTRILTTVMGAVAAVSLAIGAVAREVLLQFLVEAVVLACLGGLIGLVLALIATFVMAPLIQVPFLFL